MLDVSIAFSLDLLHDLVPARFVAGTRFVLLKPVSKGLDRSIPLANRVLCGFDLLGLAF
jgi:hypothetical protein